MPEFLGGKHIRKIVRQGTDKAPFGRVTVQTSGQMAVVRVHSVRPERVSGRRGADLVPELERALKRTVTVDVTPEAHAVHKYIRLSPNKARRIMDEVRGRYVDEALGILQFMPNKAARYVSKLIRSAAANAFEGWGAEPTELKVSLLTADPGPTMKRIQPRAMGRAYRILKRSSHLSVAVTQAEPRPVKSGRRPARGSAKVKRADAAGGAVKTKPSAKEKPAVEEGGAEEA